MSEMVRIGHGYDIHRLQSGGKLVVGGVVVSDDVSAIAHSDGDVIIHAFVDALLGAIGRGDIGEMFADADERWRGADSRIFLQQAYAMVQEAGFRLGNADVTLLLERPKIASFKQQIIDTLQQLTHHHGTINVKAGTNERCDAVGRGEAIAAHAVVLLVGQQ